MTTYTSCEFCVRKVLLKGRPSGWLLVGTHGMRNHLKSAHSKAWLDLLKEEEAEKQSKLKNSKPAKKDQQTIDATFTKLDKINPQGQRQSDYDRALLELIVSR